MSITCLPSISSHVCQVFPHMFAKYFLTCLSRKVKKMENYRLQWRNVESC